jgi:hypothetical protein
MIATPFAFTCLPTYLPMLFPLNAIEEIYVKHTSLSIYPKKIFTHPYGPFYAGVSLNTGRPPAPYGLSVLDYKVVIINMRVLNLS